MQAKEAALFQALNRLSHSREFNFAESRLGDSDLCDTIIPAIVSKRTPIKRMDLGSNELSVSSFIALVNKLLEEGDNGLFVSRLDVSRNMIVGSLPCMPEFRDAINLSLTELDLSFNKVGTDGCALLANVLPKMVNLNTLIMSTCSIDDQALEALAPGIVQCKSLTYLNLMFNGIGEAGISSLIKAGITRVRLRRLELAGNVLGRSGTECLALCLPLMNLVRLGLESNFIAHPIPKFLSAVQSSTLRSLSLDTNLGLDRSMPDIAKLLPKTGLWTLSLNWIDCDLADRQKISSRLEFQRSPDYLNLITLCSARTRVGAKSPVKQLPSELIRRCASMLVTCSAM